MKIDTYIKATLGSLDFYFPIHGPKNTLVCRNCQMCQTDPTDKLRERCELTKQILPFADTYIDGRCPLVFEEEVHLTNE